MKTPPHPVSILAGCGRLDIMKPQKKFQECINKLHFLSAGTRTISSGDSKKLLIVRRGVRGGPVSQSRASSEKVVKEFRGLSTSDFAKLFGGQ